MLGQLLGMLDVTSIIIFILVFILGYHWLTTPRNLPPGPFRLPMVGSILSLAVSGSDIMKVFDKWHLKYGDIVSLQLGNTGFVVLNSFQAIQEAFVKKGDVFSGRPCNMYIVKKIIESTGIGVIISEGSTWKKLRRVTLMTMRDFGVGKKSLEERVREEASAVMDVLDKCQGHEICLKSLLSKCTSNIICNIIFGSRFDYDDARFVELTALMEEFTKENGLFTPVNYFPFLRIFPFAQVAVTTTVNNLKKVDNYIETLLKDHQETYDPNEIRDFIDLYIKTGKESKDTRLYSASNMRRTIVDLFGAGTETSSTTLDWLVLYMVQFPQVQARCQREIDQVLGQERMAETEDRKKLPYVEAVICEVLRLAPAAPLGVPHSAVKEGTLAGYTIPAETIIFGNLWAINRDSKTWPDPLAFKPERFLNEEGHLTALKDQVLSFSTGPRVCLGEALARMEIFILFTTLLQFYTFTMDKGRTPDLEGHFGFTYSARDQRVLATKR